MPGKFTLDLEKIAKANPRVNLDDLRESQKVQEQLKQEGYVKKGFQLTTPFERVKSGGVKNEARTRTDPSGRQDHVF